MSGWYMYFNGNGTCIIDNVEASLSSWDARLTDDEIIEISRSKHDKMLRNRAVVWGGTDIGSTSRVFADLSRTTTWNYDNRDKRAILFANGDIATSAEAQDLAYTLLEEFARIEDEKVIKLAGFQGLNVGDTVLIRSQYYDGLGFVSVLHVEASDNGYITTITIDKRCPRLFGYWGWGQGVGDDSGEVFVGTNGFGVWKKARGSQWWSDFSDGIGDLYIKDLAIANGIYACVTVNGYMYTRTVDMSYWSVVSYGLFIDEISGATIEAYPIACAINRSTSEIYGLFTNGERGWVGIVQDNYVIGAQQVRLGNQTTLIPIDMDTDDNRAYVTVGTSLAVSPMFHNEPFPVVEAWTRNDETEYRHFGVSGYVLNNDLMSGHATNSIWELGKVHHGQLYVDKVARTEDFNTVRLISHEFDNSVGVDTNVTDWMTLSGGYHPTGGYGQQGYLYKGLNTGNIYWRRYGTSNDDHVYYKYIPATESFEYFCDENFSPSFSGESVAGGFVNMVHWEIEYYNGSYNFYWKDYETGTTGTVPNFATHGTYDHEYYWDDHSRTYSSSVFLNKLVFCCAFEGDMDNSATDNAYDGITPGPEEGLQAWLVVFVWDALSKSTITSRCKLIHPNDELHASDADATGHSGRVVRSNVSSFFGMWSHIEYTEGHPIIYGQLDVEDQGPWIYTGGTPPYELQGSRYPDEEDSYYPRAYAYDPIADIFYGFDEDTWEIGIEASHQWTFFLRKSNSAANAYYCNTYHNSINNFGEGFRHAKTGVASVNDTLEDWNNYYAKDTLNDKYDYNDHLHPSVGGAIVYTNEEHTAGYRKLVLAGYNPTIVNDPITTSAWSYLIDLNTRCRWYVNEGSYGGATIIVEQGSQNVMEASIEDVYYRPTLDPWNYKKHYGKAYWQFGEWENFMDVGVYATTMSTVSGFEIIDITRSPHRLEVAPSGPIITFPHQDDSGIVSLSGWEAEGGLRIGLLASGLSLPTTGWTFGDQFPSGFTPDFHFYTPPAPEGEYTVIMDARPFSMNPASELMVTSGILTISGVYIPSGIMNVGILMTDKVWIRNAYDSDSVSGWSVLVTFSGEYVSKFETTNHFDPPYFFVSTAPGLVQSGYVTNPSGYLNFYERHVGSSWSNYTAGLPSGYITVIRCDDLL
jgi:hypothetical protein